MIWPISRKTTLTLSPVYTPVKGEGISRLSI